MSNNSLSLKEVLGRTITYLDYLGEKQIGSVVYAEPGQGITDENDEYHDVVWLYIKSENDKENIKTKLIGSNGQSVSYCELRPSYQCYLETN